MEWYTVWKLVWDAGPVLGLVAAVFAFFIWKDWKREMRLQTRIEALEKDQKDILFPLVQQCSVIIAQNTVVMQRLEKVLEKAGSIEVQDEKDLIARLLKDAAAHRQDAE